MDNKLISISRIISALFINVILLFIFFNTTQMTKIIMIPFMICAVAMLGQNIFALIGNIDLVRIFQKLYESSFLLFWFGFLCFWCYKTIKQGEYFLTIFSLPFWIMGILISMKTFIKKEN